MEQFIIYLALILSGLCLGSFAGASVWRLRARQLEDDKAQGEHVDSSEYKQLKKLVGTSILGDRSKCLHCSYVLKWYDLIPLFSWISLRNKCRKCHKQIGFLEPLIELSVAVFFVLSYAFWPYALNNGLEIARLILWLMAGVGLAILFVYDKKWFLLPSLINYIVIGIGVCSAILVILITQDKLSAILGVVGAIFILSGFYWILDKISNGRWIGSGDVWLGLGLALLLANWQLAFIALFAANFVGCLIVLPAMIAKKLNLKSHVPFGPLLIVGFVIAGLTGSYLINAYFSILA